jgi:FlaA1/EpsC-like NDP-sugar epimerase
VAASDNEFFQGKRVMVTGCCGTMGSELVRRLLGMHGGPREVIGIDNNESALFIQGLEWAADGRAHFFLCDLRDARTLGDIMADIDIVLHSAALKHVVMCERSPMQAVEANITGLQNVINAAADRNVEKLIFTSSDKAVNPNSVMGLTKLMGERMISAANANRRGARTIFSSTRFGNVIGSNGSVFHIFKNQIAAGQPVTLTHPGMTRFVMSPAEAADLVLKSAAAAQGGEVFVFKSMPMVRIVDLAKAMIEVLGPGHGSAAKDIAVVEIGLKTGEKRYEQLLSEEECSRAFAFGDFLVIKPAFLGYHKEADYGHGQPGMLEPIEALRSDKGPFLSVHEITERLQEWNLL